MIIAVDFDGTCVTHDIPLFGVNENPTQKDWTSSPKPYVDWDIVKYHLHAKNIL